MGDVHAESPPEALMDPTDPWGTLGAHVVEAKGARGARFGGGVSVVSLQVKQARSCGGATSVSKFSEDSARCWAKRGACSPRAPYTRWLASHF